MISWLLENANPIEKISLEIPIRSRKSGLLSNNRQIIVQDEILDHLCILMGGRVAESIVFNKLSTNSEEDLRSLTELARKTVEQFGMSQIIGNVSFSDDYKPYSKKLNAKIDVEANKLIAAVTKKVHQTIISNSEKLHLLANELSKKKQLDYKDVVHLIGEPTSKLIKILD